MTRSGWHHISNLTPPERETVLLTSDADDHYDIWTAQRPVITKLRKNPAAELLEEGHYGTTAWARFKLPANLVSFRSVTRSQKRTAEQREAAASHLRKLNAERRGAA